MTFPRGDRSIPPDDKAMTQARDLAAARLEHSAPGRPDEANIMEAARRIRDGEDDHSYAVKHALAVLERDGHE